jgi:hypothetical protein
MRRRDDAARQRTEQLSPLSAVSERLGENSRAARDGAV